MQGKEWKFSPWDRIDVEDPKVTLSGFIDLLEDRYGLALNMLSSGVSILYSDFMNKKKVEERKNMTVVDIVQSVTHKIIPSTQKFLVLEVLCNDSETDEEVEIPYVRFRLY